MPLCLTQRIEEIVASVTGRSTSLFADDLQASTETLRQTIAGKRVLAVGAAGSIGSATVLELLNYQPRSLGVIDPSENNLAELIRSVRSDGQHAQLDLAIAPVGYGTPLAERWLAGQEAYDLVLVFAALKHVRSERDAISILRMLQVNLVEADRFLSVCRRQGHGQLGVFVVSTDKAADPVNVMGASKRLVETLLYWHGRDGSPASLIDGGDAPALPLVSSTRFANVAFSDGSLPWAFLQRIEKNQPLAWATGIRRYLVSPRESGHLCLLAAVAAANRRIAIPRLNPETDAFSFDAVAHATLATYGYQPAYCDDDQQARESVASYQADGQWPVVATPVNTDGEKPIEVFVGSGETLGATDLRAIAEVVMTPSASLADMQRFMGYLDAEVTHVDGDRQKQDLVEAMASVVPGFQHISTGRSLDGRM